MRPKFQPWYYYKSCASFLTTHATSVYSVSIPSWLANSMWENDNQSPPLKARQNTWGKKWTKTNMSRLSVQQSCPISKINDTRAIIDCAIQAQIFPYHHNEFFHISTKWLQMSTLLNQYWSSYTCYRVVEWFAVDALTWVQSNSSECVYAVWKVYFYFVLVIKL